MVGYIYYKVIDVIPSHVKKTNYVALTCDEVTSIDNGSWISIHAYVMQDWIRIPLFISLEEVVNGAHVDNLIIVLMSDLEQKYHLRLMILSQNCYVLEPMVLTHSKTTKLVLSNKLHPSMLLVALEYIVWLT